MSYFKEGEYVMCKKDYNLEGNIIFESNMLYKVKKCDHTYEIYSNEKVYMVIMEYFNAIFYSKEELRQIKIKQILE